jgi:hypothetical protein
MIVLQVFGYLCILDQVVQAAADDRESEHILSVCATDYRKISNQICSR